MPHDPQRHHGISRPLNARLKALAPPPPPPPSPASKGPLGQGTNPRVGGGGLLPERLRTAGCPPPPPCAIRHKTRGTGWQITPPDPRESWRMDRRRFVQFDDRIPPPPPPKRAFSCPRTTELSPAAAAPPTPPAFAVPQGTRAACAAPAPRHVSDHSAAATVVEAGRLGGGTLPSPLFRGPLAEFCSTTQHLPGGGGGLTPPPLRAVVRGQ